MPQGHAPKREVKKQKKKENKSVLITAPVVSPSEVEIVRKKRKPIDEEES